MTTKTNNRQPKFALSQKDIFECSKERVDSTEHGSSVIIPHVCNNIDVFGAGFASAVESKYPIAKINYHMLGKNFLKNNLGYCQIINVYSNTKTKQSIYIANMIAQNGTISRNNPRPINYLALAKSMSLVSNFIVKETNTNEHIDSIEIHCPKFGSGLAGGNWNFISDLIEDIWNKFSVTVHILGRN